MMNSDSNNKNERKREREITFNSEPQNATIYINDKPILDEEGNPGRTPIVIVIHEGKYEVTYKLENEEYEDYHTSIEVSANSPDTVIGKLKLKLKSTNNDKNKNEKDNDSLKLESNQSKIDNQINNSTDNITDIPSILKQLLISQQKMCEMMEENLKRESESKTNIEKFLNYQSKINEQVKGRESISRGDLKEKKFLNYLDRHYTTSTGNGGGVIASDPNDFDSPLYLVVPVYQELERNADYIEVSNDGNGTLWCIISHGGMTSVSKEEPIYAGEQKTYKNVWDLRFRSATTGLSFRVTEYKIETGNLSCDTDAVGVCYDGSRIDPRDIRSLTCSTDYVTTCPVTKDATWMHATEVTAPAAGTALVSKTVTAGKSGYIYGFLISTEENNDFLINWTSGGVAKSIRIVFASAGTVENSETDIAMNVGLLADATTAITITNVNAGNSGIIYQARLKYYET